MILAGDPKEPEAIGILPAPQLETEVAALVRREFSIEARIDRARRQHRARRHLIRFYRLAKAAEIAA